MNFVIIGTKDEVLGELDLGGSLWRQRVKTNVFENINNIEVPITRSGMVRIGQLRTGNEIIEGPVGYSGQIYEGSMLTCHPGTLTLKFNERFDWDKLMTSPSFDEGEVIRQVMEEVSPDMALKDIVRTAVRKTREAMTVGV